MDLHKLIEALESLRQADDSNRLQAYQQVREQIEPLSKTAGQLQKLQIVHASDSIAIKRAIDWLDGAEEQGRDCLAMLDFLASDDVFDELRTVRASLEDVSESVSLPVNVLGVLMEMYEAHPKILPYSGYLFTSDTVNNAMKDLNDKGLVKKQGKQGRNVLTDAGIKFAERHKNKSSKTE